MVLKVVIGLGNPGLQYEMTRHNAGYRLAEELAIKCGVNFNRKSELHCELGKTNLNGQELLIVRPLTFMNLSGRAAQAVLRWYKIDTKDMLVLHDEVSLPLGKLRLQHARGAGGHHGIESIIESLSGSKNFDRLKLGVGPDPGGATRGDYLLSKFSSEQLPAYNELIVRGLLAVDIWLKDGVLEAMNKLNGNDSQPAAKDSES